MITIRYHCGRWRWCCHYCDPPAQGSRNNWADILKISLPRHFRVRYFHHRYVSRKGSAR